jgi:hypothetical protein
MLGNVVLGISISREGAVRRGTRGLNPPLSDNRCRPRIVREQRAMIGGAQNVINSNPVVGQREQSTAIEDWRAANCCLALDDQTAARREDRRQMRKEQARQCVPGAERDRQVLAHGDEVRELDWRLHSDHQAVRPVATHHPGIDLIESRKAFSRGHFRPVAQHALDQTTLFPLGSRRTGFW